MASDAGGELATPAGPVGLPERVIRYLRDHEAPPWFFLSFLVAGWGNLAMAALGFSFPAHRVAIGVGFILLALGEFAQDENRNATLALRVAGGVVLIAAVGSHFSLRLAPLLASPPPPPKNSVAELWRQPIVAPPPGATEVLRVEVEPRAARKAMGGGMIPYERGEILVVYALPDEWRAAEWWYHDNFTEWWHHYNFAERWRPTNPTAFFFPEPMYGEWGPPGEIARFRVSVEFSPSVPYFGSGEELTPRPAPPGTNSYAIVALGYLAYE